MKIFVLITFLIIILIIGTTLIFNKNLREYGNTFNAGQNELISNDITPQPKTFSSCDEFKNILTQNIKTNSGFDVLLNLNIVNSKDANEPEQNTYPLIDTRQKNSDDADVVKSDGKYIYILTNNTLQILNADPKAENNFVSKINIADNLTVDKFFLNNDKLLIFGIKKSEDLSSKTRLSGEKWTGTNIFPDIAPQYVETSFIKLFDIIDKENPLLIRDLEINGKIATIQKLNKQVYFIINNKLLNLTASDLEKMDNNQISNLLPKYKDADEINDTTPAKLLNECDKIDYIKPVQEINFTSIIGISIQDKNKELEIKTILGSGENIYLNENNIYLTNTVFDIIGAQQEKAPSKAPLILPYLSSDERTNIYKFSINNNGITYQTSSSIHGRLLNQFSIDEFKENLRIFATSKHFNRKGASEFENNLFILDKNLNAVSFLTNIAPGEKIQNIQFISNKIFLAVSESQSPMFALDLIEPKNPKSIGRINLITTANYLYPYDDNNVISIAKNSNPDLRQGIKITIYNISDLKNTKEIFNLSIGDNGSNSPAIQNPKDLLLLKNKNLLILPILETKSDEETLSTKPIYQGSYIFNINPYVDLNIKGKITAFNENELTSDYINNKQVITKNLLINNLLYSISKEKIIITNPYNLSKIEEIELINSNTFQEN